MAKVTLQRKASRGRKGVDSRVKAQKRGFIIKVDMTAEEYGRTERKTAGVTTGLGICEFAALLLETNGVCPKHRRMIDSTMEQIIAEEFPGRKVVEKMKTGKINMGYWRTLYNLGRLTGGEIPTTYSERYDHHGNVIPNRKKRPPRPGEEGYETWRKSREERKAKVQTEKAVVG